MNSTQVSTSARGRIEINLSVEDSRPVELSLTSARLDRMHVRDDDRGSSVSVLDAFSFRAQGRALTLSSVPRKLLALLAVRGHPMTRLLVAGTLWPEASDRDAASSLRSALWRLRNAIGDALVVTNVDLALHPDIKVDLHDSRALARRLISNSAARLPGDTSAAAVQMLSGDLLPGWYDDWVLTEGDEWHQLRMHALEALAVQLTKEGRCADAIQAALATVRAEPLRESAHGALIRSFIAEGNQNEALNDFYKFRDLLREELGIEPSPQLTDLVDDLLNRRPEATAGRPG